MQQKQLKKTLKAEKKKQKKHAMKYESTLSSVQESEHDERWDSEKYDLKHPKKLGGLDFRLSNSGNIFKISLIVFVVSKFEIIRTNSSTWTRVKTKWTW